MKIEQSNWNNFNQTDLQLYQKWEISTISRPFATFVRLWSCGEKKLKAWPDMFRHVASMILVWTMFHGCWLKTTGQASRVIIVTPLTIVTPMMFEGNRIMIILYYSANQFFFQSYLLKDSQSDNHVAGIKDYNDTLTDTFSGLQNGPGWPEAIWWRPLVMNPVKSHSWNLVFWSWKLRPLLCASARNQTEKKRLCNAVVTSWSYENEGLQDASSAFFGGRILKKPCLVLEKPWKNNARISPTLQLARSGVHGTCRTYRIAASADALDAHAMVVGMKLWLGTVGILIVQNPYWHEERITKTCWTMVKHLNMNFYRWVLLCFTCNPTHVLPKIGDCREVAAMRHGQHSRLTEASMQGMYGNVV